MTAHAQRHDRDRCLREGTDDYLSKPVALTQLSRVLMRWAPLPSTEAPASVKADGTGNHGRVLNPAALAQIKAMQDPGEPSPLGHLVETFRASPAAYLARLKGGKYAFDADSARDAAHALKGAAASTGAERVRAIALDVEQRAREGPLNGAEERLMNLEAAREQALLALAREVAAAP